MSLSLSPLVSRLKAAAEPSRLRLLAACAACELTVTELTRILGQSQPRISRHLKKLCEAGLLLRFREGHFVYYRVPAAGSARRLVASLLSGLCKNDETIRRDLAVLEDVQKDRAERARAVLANSEWVGDICDAGLSEDAIGAAILKLTDLDNIGDLLDIGTGTGRILKLFGPYARSAVGIDISAEMLLVARSNVQAAGLNSVVVRHGDMYRLPYPDATFDTVTVDQVLREAEHPERVLAEAGRILQPAGQLIVMDVLDASAGPGLTDGARLRGWVAAAGLALCDVLRLHGESVTVILSLLRHNARSEDEAA